MRPPVPLRQRATLWLVALCLVGALVAGIVARELHGREPELDRRNEKWSAFLDHPDTFSATYATRIAPALDTAIAGDDYDPNDLVFVADTFVAEKSAVAFGSQGGVTTNADLRHASKSQSAPALDELWDIAFHWDDLMIAAHASGGDDIRADALLSARAVDVASSLRAAEERAVDRAHEQQRHRLILQWIKWVLAVIALALFVAAPAVLLSTMLRIEADREKYAAQLGSTHHAGDVEASELAPA